MSNELQIFNFENKNVEIIEINNEPLFNARNVGECLEISNIRDTIRGFDKDEVVKLTNETSFDAVGVTGGRVFNGMGELFLTEAGLYKIVSVSRKVSFAKKQKFLQELFPNKNYFPVLSSKEGEFFEDLSKTLIAFGLDIERQVSVGKYRVDGYIRKFNVVIEFDEKKHEKYNQEKEEERTVFIKEILKCKIIRVSDQVCNLYNIGYVIKNLIEFFQGALINEK